MTDERTASDVVGWLNSEGPLSTSPQPSASQEEPTQANSGVQAPQPPPVNLMDALRKGLENALKASAKESD